MPLGEIGAFFLVVVVVFIFGNLWFHFVESILNRLKRLFIRPKDTPWHPLPPEQEEKQDD